MSCFKPLVAALLFACCASLAHAQQTEFTSRTLDEQAHFTYRWIDSTGQAKGMIIALTRKDVSDALNDPKTRIKPYQIEQWLFDQVKMRADQLTDRNYEIKVIKHSTKIEITGSGLNEAELQARVKLVGQAHEQAIAKLQQTSYFTLVEGRLLLDYQRIVQDSSPALGPLAAYFGSSDGSLRGYVDNYLSFLQTIPYDALDRGDEFGLYTPLHMLISNRGDCESKQLALATLVRGVQPGAKMIMVGLVDHVIVGIKMTPKPGDQTYHHKGEIYVLMDATGPAMTPAGYIAPREIERLRAGKAEVYPL